MLMTHTIQDRLKYWMWEADLSKTPKPIAFLIRIARIIFRVGRDLADGQLSLQAMSLVYTTLITLVPLLALSFSVLKGFGVHNQIEPFLLSMFEPFGDQGVEIADKIIQFVDNIKVGVLGAVGLALLLYSVVALMQKIERAFNFIWRVDRPRRLAQRFSDYLSVLLIGPFLIFLSAGITGTVRNVEILERFGIASVIDGGMEMMAIFIPYLIMGLAFTFIYMFMPNTKVRFGAAFVGGLFAALMWKLMGYVFSTIIASSANYVAIYAAFATLIIFMVWTYLAWLVVLIGANISFYVQHPRFTRFGRNAQNLSSRMKEDLALGILYHIGRKYYDGQKGSSAEELNQVLRTPITFIYQVLELLVQQNIIVCSDEKIQRYTPAVPYDQTTIAELLEKIRQFGEQSYPYERGQMPDALRKFRKDADAAFAKGAGKMTLKDFIKKV